MDDAVRRRCSVLSKEQSLNNHQKSWIRRRHDVNDAVSVASNNSSAGTYIWSLSTSQIGRGHPSLISGRSHTVLT